MEEFYGFVFYLSKFDTGMATTARNQMQCRQSCSWQLLICFEQRQIFQVFWLLYFFWVEVICFLLVEKPVCTVSLKKKKKGTYIYIRKTTVSNSCLFSSFLLLFDLLFLFFLFILFLCMCPDHSPYSFRCYSACF